MSNLFPERPEDKKLLLDKKEEVCSTCNEVLPKTGVCDNCE